MPQAPSCGTINMCSYKRKNSVRFVLNFDDGLIAAISREIEQNGLVSGIKDETALNI